MVSVTFFSVVWSLYFGGNVSTFLKVTSVMFLMLPKVNECRPSAASPEDEPLTGRDRVQRPTLGAEPRGCFYRDPF